MTSSKNTFFSKITAQASRLIFPTRQKNYEFDNSQMHCNCYTRYKSPPIFQISEIIVKTEIRLLLGVPISRNFHVIFIYFSPFGGGRRAPWGRAPAEGPPWGERPPRAPWGGGARRGASGGGQVGIGTPPKDYTKPPTDNTEPRQTTQSPNRQYKAPTDNTKPQNSIQDPKILDKTQNVKQIPKVLHKSSNKWWINTEY